MRMEVDGLIAAFVYEGRMRQALHDLKFSRKTALVGPLAEILAERIDFSYDLVVPVPIHWTRRALRGFNQAELLCDCLPSELIKTDILVRTRMTRPQRLLGKSDRTRNVDGAFLAKKRLDGMSLVLVDDICTSGATLRACIDALKLVGAKEVRPVVVAATLD